MTTATATPTLTLDRATLYMGGLMGWTTQRAREIAVYEGVRYAQYRRAVRVEYTPKGKRRRRRIMLTHEPELVIVSGWHAPEYDPRRMKRIDGMTSQSRHSACSSAWSAEFAAWLAGQVAEGMTLAADYRGHNTGES